MKDLQALLANLAERADEISAGRLDALHSARRVAAGA